MRWYHWLVLALVLVVGCALTDQQIDQIVASVESGTQAVVETGIEVAAPAIPGVDWGSSGIAGGLAAAAAAGVGLLTRMILRAVRKKPGG